MEPTQKVVFSILHVHFMQSNNSSNVAQGQVSFDRTTIPKLYLHKGQANQRIPEMKDLFHLSSDAMCLFLQPAFILQSVNFTNLQ